MVYLQCRYLTLPHFLPVTPRQTVILDNVHPDTAVYVCLSLSESADRRDVSQICWVSLEICAVLYGEDAVSVSSVCGWFFKRQKHSCSYYVKKRSLARKCLIVTLISYAIHIIKYILQQQQYYTRVSVLIFNHFCQGLAEIQIADIGSLKISTWECLLDTVELLWQMIKLIVVVEPI